MFSIAQQKEDAIAIKIRRGIIQAKQRHPEYLDKHSDEVKDVQAGNYTKLKARIITETKRKQQRAIERRDKYGNKK